MSTLSNNGGTIYIRQQTTTSAIEYSTNNSTWTSLGTSWPVFIINTNPSAANILTVLFTNSLYISSTSVGTNGTSGYFIIGSEYITFNGNSYTVTINAITNYLGLIQNGSPDGGFSNIAIKNIGVLISGGSTLNSRAGWIGHREYARNYNNCTVDNCYSNGYINGGEAGGIIGYSSNVNVTNCYSTGTIEGGGIVGSSATGIVRNCYSTGYISGGGGGIAGPRFSGTITNSYSTGDISGDYSGGIAGPIFSGTINNCYSTGIIRGKFSGGISGGLSSGTITNSYSTGAIQGNYSGGIVGSQFSQNISTLSIISDCSSSGNITGLNAGGICGSLAAYANSTIQPYLIIKRCYSSGTVSNGGGSILGGDEGGIYVIVPRLYLININALNTPLIAPSLPTAPYIINNPIIYRAIRRPTSSIIGNVVIDVSYSLGIDPLTGFKYSIDGTTYQNVTTQNTPTNVTVAGLTNTMGYKLIILISSAYLDISTSIVLPKIDPSSVPYAPYINSVTYDVSSTVISFNEPKFDGGADISGYVYDLSMTGSVTTQILPLTTDVSFISNTLNVIQKTGTDGFRNGIYQTSESSFSESSPAWKLFNRTTDTYWHSQYQTSTGTNSGIAYSQNPYSSSGVYQGGGASNIFFTTTVNTLGTISGEWVQIQLPYKMLLNNYNVILRTGYVWDTSSRAPKTFNVVGSNDGSIWYSLDVQSPTANSDTSRNFVVSPIQTNTYSYYRFILKSIYITAASAGQLGRWVLNGNYIMDPVVRNPFSVTLSNFSPYTLRLNNLGSGTYYYKLYATNKAGTSRSTDASFILGTNTVSASTIMNTPNPPAINRVDSSNGSAIVYFESSTDVSYINYSTTGTGGTFTKSLDNLNSTSKAGLVGAYSLKKLSNFYNGPIVKLRRGSDNSQNDFYIDSYGRFVNISSTLMNTWLSGSVGYVSIWYDQSGKGKNGTQTTTTAQPNISGDFVSVPNSCYMNFPDACYFNLPDGTVPSGNSSYTITYKHGVINNIVGTIVGSGSYTNINQTLVARRDTNTYVHYWWANDHTFGTYTPNNIITQIYDPSNGLTNSRIAYLNGSLNSTNTPSASRNSGIANNTIGAGYTGGSLNGDLYYLYLFNIALPDTDRTILENNIVTVSPLYPFIIPNLTNGTSYSISLTGTSSLGTSSPSDIVTVTPGVPANPTVTVTPRFKQLDVSSSYTTYGLTTTYYYNLNGGTDISSASPQYSFTGLTAGQPYNIYVRASNTYGYSPYTIVSATSYETPSSPSFVTVTQNAGINRMDVSFGAPVSNGGSPITNYFYTYTGQGGSYTSLSSAVPVTFSILNPIKGSSITVSVIAQNIAGNSAPTSSIITIVPDTIYFNGANTSYIDISNTTDLSFGTGDFTIEWMQYSTGTSLVPYIFKKGALGVSIEFNNLLYNWPYTSPTKIENYKNRWAHIAISRVSGTKYIFFDGLLISSASDSTNYTNLSNFTIGNNSIKSSASAFQGYLYNFHIVKGVGKYNANFVVSNTGISTMSGTAVLINGYDVSGSSASSVNKVGVSISFQAIYTVPGQVSAVSATGGYKMIVCRFTAPTYTGGLPILGYRYSTDGGVTYVNINSAVNTGTSVSNPYFTIRDLADNTAYNVNVVAYNKYGNGIPSLGVTTTTVFSGSNIPQTVNVLSVLPTQENFNIGYENKMAVVAANSYSYAINDGSFVNVAKANPILVGMSPPVFSIGTITLNSVTINYTLPSYPILRYYYSVRTTTGFVMDGSFNVVTYPSSYTITGIVPNTPYKISLQSVDANGLGPRTTIVHYYELAPPAPVTG